MFDNEILTTGQKLYEIRKKLNLTQEDLAEGFSRTNIYLYEKKNKKIPPDIGKIIVRKLNEKIAFSNTNLKKITLEWLLEDEDTQANNLVIKYKEKLMQAKENKEQIDGIIKDINYVEILIKTYKIRKDLILEIYTCAVEMYYSYNSIQECKIYALKTYNMAAINKSWSYFMKAILYIIRSLYKLGQYMDIEVYAEIAIKAGQDYKIERNEDLIIIYYNTASAFSKLEKPQKCIEYLEYLKDFNLLPEKRFDTMLLKAVSYRKLNRYEEAEAILYKVINEAKEKENLNAIALAYSNLATLKAKTNSLEEIFKYIDFAINIRCSNSYRVIILHDCINSAIKCDYKKFIVENYLMAIESVLQLKDKNMINETISQIFNYFKKNSMIEEIELLLSTVSNMIFQYQITNIELGYIFLDAIEIFKGTSNKERVLDLCLKVQHTLLIRSKY